MNNNRITIVGGGTSGWITAAVLSKELCAKGVEIQLVESADVPTIGVGEATIPPIILLLDYLELDRKDFLEKVNGTFKYGIHFENWSNIGEKYMHSFGAMGTPLNSIPFTQLWLANVSQNNLSHFNDYSASAIAAYAGKFHPPVARPKGASSNHFFPLNSLQYAYHFDAALLVSVLKEYALAKGVKQTIGTVESIHNADHSDDIESIRLSNGEEITADLFVDCSGMRGLFNKQHFQCEFNDWSHFLPCNSAIAMQTKIDTPPVPYTKSIAMDAGWRWQIPLRNRLGNGYVYSDEFISDEKAEVDLCSALSEHEIVAEPRRLKFKTGCLTQPWFRNSVAIGLSSGFFEPLESTSIHLVHKYAILLKDALLGDKQTKQVRKDFNTSFMEDALAIRDFLVAHYCITDRQDTEFWRHCRSMNIPQSLQDILIEFKQTASISLRENNLFSYDSWLMLLTGQKYLKDYSHFAKLFPNHGVQPQFFNNVKMAINNEVSKLQSHQEYLAQ